MAQRENCATDQAERVRLERICPERICPERICPERSWRPAMMSPSADRSNWRLARPEHANAT